MKRTESRMKLEEVGLATLKGGRKVQTFALTFFVPVPMQQTPGTTEMVLFRELIHFGLN